MWIKLSSVKCHIDNDTGEVYPDGDFGETTRSFHINDVDTRWWENVSPDDRERLRGAAISAERKINMDKWKEEK